MERIVLIIFILVAIAMEMSAQSSPDSLLIETELTEVVVETQRIPWSEGIYVR